MPLMSCIVALLLTALHEQKSCGTQVGWMCDVTGIFVQGYMPITWNVCIPVLVVTLLIALNLYEAYVLSYLSDMCTWPDWYILLICSIEEHISFGHMYGNNMSPVTWFWRCHQWQYYICHIEMIVWRSYMTFCASASISAGIIVMYHWWSHWYQVMLKSVVSHDYK